MLVKVYTKINRECCKSFYSGGNYEEIISNANVRSNDSSIDAGSCVCRDTKSYGF